MKFSLGGKQSIEFKTDVKGLEEFAPVKPAKFFLPQWFKDMSDYIEQDAHGQHGKKVFLVIKEILLKNGVVEP